MKLFMHNWPWVLTLLVLGVFVSGLLAIIEGYIDGKNKIKRSPREEMYWCHIHGAFRKKHCLPLFPELKGTQVNSFVCPTCYKKTVFDDVKV